MLPPDYDSYYLGLFFRLEDHIGNLGSHDSFAKCKFFAAYSIDKLGQMCKSIRRLTAELNLILIVLKIIAKLKLIII